jgi:HD superfamily phosphohydrolase
VKAVDGDNFDYMICFPEKCWSDAYEFFHTRYVMHRDVYSHKTCKKIDFMVSDILEKADDYVLLPGKVGPDGKVKRYKISECHQDPAAYCLLRDDILSLILLTDDPNLAEAKSLIERIESRKLYSSVGRMSWIEAFNGKGKEDIEEEIVGTVDGLLRKGDLIIEFLDLHHGRGDENPLRELRFFTKNATSKDVAKVMRQKNEEDWGATLPRRFRVSQVSFGIHLSYFGVTFVGLALGKEYLQI